MATTPILVGDTITVQATFKDDNGVVTDPDGLTATFTAYNEDERQVATGSTSRVAAGVYVYDWEVPFPEGVVYFLEMKAIFQGHPQLNRIKVRTKFKI